jgi:hypothetical protein
MKKYPSTEELRQVFDYVDGCLYWKIKPNRNIPIGRKVGRPCSNGYLRADYKKETYLLHRFIWVWHGNELKESMEIDHINYDRTDNRIENLQQLTRAKHDTRKRGKYVFYHKTMKRWQAYTKQTNKTKSEVIGYYNTKAEALRAVKAYHERGCPSQ